MRRSLAWSPALLLLAMPALLLWTVGRGPGQVIGVDSVDLRGHLWTVHSVSQGAFPHSELVAFPEGVDLVPVLGGWLDVLLGGALAVLVGPAWGFNLVACLYMGLAGLGAMALARALGVGWTWAVVAGLLLQVDGLVLEHLSGGRPEQVGVGFVALAIAAWVRALRTDRARAGVWAGLATGLVVWVCWEWTAWLGLAGGVFLPLAMQRWRGWRALAAGVGTAALVAGPVMLMFLVAALESRGDLAGADGRLGVHGSVGLLEWWLPSQPRPTYAALLGVGAVVWAARRSGLARALVLGLGLSLALMLGAEPSLWVGEGAFAPAGPYAWLRLVPVLGWMHWPDRFAIAWALVAPVGLAWGLWRMSAARPRLAGAMAVVAVLLGWGEARLTGYWPSAQLVLPVSDAGAWLAQTTGPGAVLDLPATGRGQVPWSNELLQLQHRRPLVSTAHRGELVGDADAAGWTEQPAMDWLRDFRGPRFRFGAPPEPADLADLRARGLRFLVLHPERLPARARTAARRALEEQLGDPRFCGEQKICIWELPAGVPSPEAVP